MSIPKGAQKNFETLRRAFANDDVCLLEVVDKKTGEVMDAICATTKISEGIGLTPLAVMVRENPYERFEPPSYNEMLIEETGDGHSKVL